MKYCFCAFMSFFIIIGLISCGYQAPIKFDASSLLSQHNDATAILVMNSKFLSDKGERTFAAQNSDTWEKLKPYVMSSPKLQCRKEFNQALIISYSSLIREASLKLGTESCGLRSACVFHPVATAVVFPADFLQSIKDIDGWEHEYCTPYVNPKTGATVVNGN